MSRFVTFLRLIVFRLPVNILPVSGTSVYSISGGSNEESTTSPSCEWNQSVKGGDTPDTYRHRIVLSFSLPERRSGMILTEAVRSSSSPVRFHASALFNVPLLSDLSQVDLEPSSHLPHLLPENWVSSQLDVSHREIKCLTFTIRSPLPALPSLSTSHALEAALSFFFCLTFYGNPPGKEKATASKEQGSRMHLMERFKRAIHPRRLTTNSISIYPNLPIGTVSYLSGSSPSPIPLRSKSPLDLFPRVSSSRMALLRSPAIHRRHSTW